jgi:hypothetical protein
VLIFVLCCCCCLLQYVLWCMYLPAKLILIEPSWH